MLTPETHRKLKERYLNVQFRKKHGHWPSVDSLPRAGKDFFLGREELIDAVKKLKTRSRVAAYFHISLLTLAKWMKYHKLTSSWKAPRMNNPFTHQVWMRGYAYLAHNQQVSVYLLKKEHYSGTNIPPQEWKDLWRKRREAIKRFLLTQPSLMGKRLQLWSDNGHLVPMQGVGALRLEVSRFTDLVELTYILGSTEGTITLPMEKYLTLIGIRAETWDICNYQTIDGIVFFADPERMFTTYCSLSGKVLTGELKTE